MRDASKWHSGKGQGRQHRRGAPHPVSTAPAVRIVQAQPPMAGQCRQSAPTKGAALRAQHAVRTRTARARTRAWKRRPGCGRVLGLRQTQGSVGCPPEAQAHSTAHNAMLPPHPSPPIHPRPSLSGDWGIIIRPGALAGKLMCSHSAVAKSNKRLPNTHAHTHAPPASAGRPTGGVRKLAGGSIRATLPTKACAVKRVITAKSTATTEASRQQVHKKCHRG